MSEIRAVCTAQPGTMVRVGTYTLPVAGWVATDLAVWPFLYDGKILDPFDEEPW